MSNDKKKVLILDRVQALEETTNGLAGFVQSEVEQLKKAVTSLVEVINGVIAAGGEGFEQKVTDAVNAARAKRAAEQVEAQKAQLAKAVEDGVLVPETTVAEGTIIVGRELDAENNVLGTGYAQVRFEQFTPEAKEQVLGQGVGFVITGPQGKFEVLEVYSIAAAKPAEVTTASEPVEAEETAPTFPGAE